MEGVPGMSKTDRTCRYYYCLNQRKKKHPAKTVHKDEIEEIQVVPRRPEDADLARRQPHRHYRIPTGAVTRSSRRLRPGAQTWKPNSRTSSIPSHRLFQRKHR